MKKYVFSKSRADFEGNPRVIQSDIAQHMQKLKQEAGKDIWLYGGAGLITTFVNLNLVDELRLAVIPIILGDGKPMLKDIRQRVKLNLLRTNSSKSGVVELVYQTVK